MQNQDILDNIYNIIRLLGRGAFSNIYLVRNINNNTEYIARVRRGNINNYQQELQMTTNASNLNNPNIIHLNNHGIGILTRGGIIHNNMHYLIQDYCSKGDLFQYNALGRFTELHSKFIFRKILNGVGALHGAGICNRNLKLETILLDQNFNPKISNFTCATMFQGNNGIINLNEIIGTDPYAPPQMFINAVYNGSKADIFSLGVILFNLVTGLRGFGRATNTDQYYTHIRNNQIAQYWNHLPNQINNMNLSQEFKNLYIRMVSFDENNRPSVNQILNDIWFNELTGLNNQQLIQLENEVRQEFLARENQIQNNPNIQPLMDNVEEFDDNH